MKYFDKITGTYVDRAEIQKVAGETATRYGIPQNVFQRLIFSESSYNPSAYNAEFGAAGIGQFIPSTAKQYGINPYDWRSSLDASAKYLSKIYPKYNDWLATVGDYKGKSGGAQDKADYANKELNKRGLVLDNGVTVPNVGAGENVTSLPSDATAKADNTKPVQGDGVINEAVDFVANKFFDVGAIIAGVVLIVFTLLKRF